MLPRPRTQGVDVAAGYLHAFDNESLLNLKVALTWADTEVIGGRGCSGNPRRA